MLEIYTTSPIISLSVERSGGNGPTATEKNQFFIEHQYSSTFDILAGYRVGIPWLTDELNGEYSVKVTNDDRESTTLGIKIVKATGK